MQTAVFYGSSDDLIEVDGVKGGDEFSALSGVGLVHGKFNVGGRMRVYALYDGCWMFAVGQVDEDILIPDWAVRLTQQHRSVGRDPGGYSARLEIDVPDDVMVFREAL